MCMRRGVGGGGGGRKSTSCRAEHFGGPTEGVRRELKQTEHGEGGCRRPEIEIKQQTLSMRQWKEGRLWL